MNADILARWFERQRYKVIHTPSSYWCEQAPRVYQAFPYHWLIAPDDDELRFLFKYCGAYGLRYSTGMNTLEGIASYHVVYTRKEYLIEQLPKKARYDIRKGLGIVKIEQIPFSRLASEGWQLRQETLLRQGRNNAECQAWWYKMCHSADGLPGFEAWGALSSAGKLVAALIAFTCDDCCSILYQQSLSDYLSYGVNNALTFVFTNAVLKRPGHPWIFYGLHSLDAPASVDAFKFRMGYTAKPVRQRVVFSSLIAPLVNSASHTIVKCLRKAYPGNPTLGKIEGMMRFYLEGKRPLNQQTLPSVMEHIQKGIDLDA